MSTTKNIVILGASYGGLSTAHYILKHAVPKLPNKASYQVIIVSTASQVMDRPACPRALISDDMFDQKKLFVDIPPLFAQYPEGSFRFVHGTATKLDHTGRIISISLAAGDTEEINYYALVIATGASTPSPLLSVNRDEVFLRSSWAAFRKALPSAKSIIIAGGGPAGIETAGELGEYLNGRAGYFASKLENPNVAITVVTASSNILPALRPSLAARAETLLAKVGVTIIKNARVQSVEPPNAGTESPASKATVKLEDGRTLEADLYIPATGMKFNTDFISKELLLTPDGRVATNPSTLRVDAAGPRVYAIGDVSAAARPAVHLVFSAIPVLGANIKRDLLLRAGEEGGPESGAAAAAAAERDREFREDTRETQMVPIGRGSWGVGAVMGWQLPGLLVWLVKGRDYWLWTTGDLWSGKQWAKES